MIEGLVAVLCEWTILKCHKQPLTANHNPLIYPLRTLNLPTAHLVSFEGLADVHLAVGRADHLHLPHLPQRTQMSDMAWELPGNQKGRIDGSRVVTFFFRRFKGSKRMRRGQTLRSMISPGRSNSSIMQRGMAPPHGLQLSIFRSIM